MYLIAKKICLIGDFSVGKTSLVRRFVDNEFSDQYLTTVGVKISRKTVAIAENNKQENKKIELLIWDIEGQTKFKSITPTYLQGAKGGIIVADVSRSETIENLTEHLNLFCSINPQSLIIIALNKIDLIAEQKIKDLAQLKHSQVIATYTTSAKFDKNVDKIFHQLASSLLNC